MSYKVKSAVALIAPAETTDDLGDANNGPRYFYEGAVVPDGFNDERCKQLVEEGMLEEVAKADSDSDGPPAKSASKADWEEYARSQGAEDSDLDGKTKDELIAEYGD